MDITPLLPSNIKIIQGYSDNTFRISGDVYKKGVFLYKDNVVELDISTFKDINGQELKGIKDINQIEYLIVGSGKSQGFLDSAVLDSYKNNNNFSIEVMNTAAACRTYNTLITEGRNVAALLCLNN